MGAKRTLICARESDGIRRSRASPEPRRARRLLPPASPPVHRARIGLRSPSRGQSSIHLATILPQATRLRSPNRPCAVVIHGASESSRAPRLTRRRFARWKMLKGAYRPSCAQARQGVTLKSALLSCRLREASTRRPPTSSPLASCRSREQSRRRGRGSPRHPGSRFATGSLQAGT